MKMISAILSVAAATLFTDVSGCGIGTDGAYKLTPYLLSDGGDVCFAWLYGTATRRAGVVLNSLHNEFTNGQLRIQVDMRAPESWAGGYAFVRVFPVFDKYMDILAWDGSWCDRNRNALSNASITNSPVTPGKFGIRSTGLDYTRAAGTTSFSRSGLRRQTVRACRCPRHLDST